MLNCPKCGRLMDTRGNLHMSVGGCLIWSYCFPCDYIYFNAKSPLSPQLQQQLENFIRFILEEEGKDDDN